jgi:ABC-type nitrate/sulfonate/bicarbonate transport system substrate-binding protein
MIRRASIVALALALGIPAAAGAQSSEPIRVASVPLDVTGNVYYAYDLGYFAKAGLDFRSRRS